MRQFTLIAMMFFLLGSGMAAIAEDQLYTTSSIKMVPARKAILTSADRSKLTKVIAGQNFTGAVQVPKDVVFIVIKRDSFTEHVDVQDGKYGTDRVQRTVNAAYVEIKGQPGNQGWVVEAYQDKGKTLYTYLRKPPSNLAASRQSSASAAADLASSPDLVVTVSRGDSRKQVAGKEIYSISVANKGGVEAKDNFTVEVRVNGKTVTSERVRGLKASGSHYFNAEISESSIRRNHTLEVIVDPDNSISEADENNNKYSRRL